MKYSDLCIESDLSNGDKSLSFVYRAKYKDIKNEYYVETQDDRYVVKEVGVSSDDFPSYKCQLDLEDLEADMLQNFSAADQTLTDAANLALVGTGWTVRTDINRKRSAAVIKGTPLSIMYKLRDAWMCEISFDTKNKIVRFADKFGKDKGVFFMRGLNLRKASLTEDSYDYYTRIIPIGQDGIGIEEVNNGKKYVENYQYSRKVRTLIWEDTSYEDPEALMEDAQKKLEDLSKPKRSYNAEIVDLAKQRSGYDLMEFSIGDTVHLIDEAAGIMDVQRIVRLVEYPQAPEKNNCELSNTTLTFDELQSRMEAAANAWEDIKNADGTVNGVYVHGVEAGGVVGIETVVNGVVDRNDTVQGIVLDMESAKNDIGTVNAELSNALLRVGTLEATSIKATEADLKYATIQSLNAIDAKVDSIDGKYAKFESVVTEEMAVNRGKIDNLETDVADINTLVNGNLTSENIHSLTLNAQNTFIENGLIKNAMIESLTFDKITGIDINTTRMTVHSEDGRSQWEDNTIQISDDNRVRVQIGKDASGDYTMAVWDRTGKLIWDALGATENTIQRKIIRDEIVADDAAIQGRKLDINSVVEEVNGATNKLKSTTILLDEKGQTLSVAFNTLETTVGKNLEEAKKYADGQAGNALSSAQQYAMDRANEMLQNANSYTEGKTGIALNMAQQAVDNGVTKLTVLYALGTSATTAPTSGWSEAAPEWVDGMYMWQKTRTVKGNGEVTDGDPTCISGAKGDPGEDAVTISILSSNGAIFKNSMIATTLIVNIVKGNEVIDSSRRMYEVFGMGAKLMWQQNGADDSYIDIPEDDLRLSDNGFLFTLTTKDIETKAVFRCLLDY